VSIAQGPITQVAWVVEDSAATEELLRGQFSVGTWTRIPDVRFGPEDCTVHGDPADFTVHVSLGYAANGTSDLQLELIQPVSGESIYTEFLAVSPPGLHHICFEVDDVEAACHSAETAGHQVLQRGSMMAGAMEFAYVDGASAGVPYVELARIGPTMREFFDDVKRHSGSAGA
jgi:catechol 2,3-dioxygenase-like lactoylglutathione lyase family enzyme